MPNNYRIYNVLGHDIQVSGVSIRNGSYRDVDFDETKVNAARMVGLGAVALDKNGKPVRKFKGKPSQGNANNTLLSESGLDSRPTATKNDAIDTDSFVKSATDTFTKHLNDDNEEK